MQMISQSPLGPLFEAIAQTSSEADLRQSVMAQLGEFFQANRWGLMLLEDLPEVNDDTPRLLKLAISLDYNPVLCYLVQRHAAVHEEVILPPGVWQTLCPRADHGHVMVGPVVSQGQLVGGIAFTRHRDHSSFDAENLADLNALCLHLSTRLAVLRAGMSVIHDTANTHPRLTPRQSEIAALVAEGMTNAQIGSALWITENSVKQALKRMFRKLEVSSRAELVAQLYRKAS